MYAANNIIKQITVINQTNHAPLSSKTVITYTKDIDKYITGKKHGKITTQIYTERHKNKHVLNNTDKLQ